MQSTAPGSAPLKVTQYHFTGWPDHGVPQNGVTLINFIRRVRTSHPYSDSRPLLVHCSAGVGRTGAFIVLDSMLQRMQGEQSLNIYEFLKQLRTQRVLMVQTQVGIIMTWNVYVNLYPLDLEYTVLVLLQFTPMCMCRPSTTSSMMH